jgi:enediyne biosynthesis protein E4
VCRFVDFSKLKHHSCFAPGIPELQGVNEYCYPRIFDPMPSWLFHNNGDGTFTDVSRQMGIAENAGKAWGVVACDINNDGFVDLFVANDTTANFLFKNRAGKKFDEIGFTAGVAYGPGGKARSGMGVDAGDYNQDGLIDLFVTNLDHEFYGLYQNRGDESFDDKAAANGVTRASKMMSGWGAKFFDFDNDGNLDLFAVNGHPDDLIDKVSPGVTYAEPLLLFQNTGGTLKDVSSQGGPLFSRPMSARGLALGDFDNDGSVDALVSVNNGAPVLLKNNAGRKNNWLGIKLAGKRANPDAVGARVAYQAGDLRRTHQKVGGGGYLSSHDPRIVLGLGQREKVDWLEVRWPQPSGKVQRWTDLPVNRYITILEGESAWK